MNDFTSLATTKRYPPNRDVEHFVPFRNDREMEPPKVPVIGGGYRWIGDHAELHAAGIECTVFEPSASIRELGVGINVPLNGHRLAAHGQPGYEIKII